MRNFDLSSYSAKGSNGPILTEVSKELDVDDGNIEISSDSKFEDLESCSPRVFGNLSPKALNYIQQLQSELTNVKKVTLRLVITSLFNPIELELVLWR